MQTVVVPWISFVKTFASFVSLAFAFKTVAGGAAAFRQNWAFRVFVGKSSKFRGSGELKLSPPLC